MLEPYGPNVATTEGATYRFHVRITASTFQDSSGVNDLVWSETAYQTRKLGEAWSQGSPRHLVTDVNALTLALISRAGFGKRVEWTSNSDDDKEVPEGYRMSFLRAMDTSTAHIVAILIAPGWLLDLSGKRETHVARDQLEKYLREMIRTERKNVADNQEYQNRGAKGNLLTSVLQASDAEEKGVQKPGETKKKGFTEQETLGNLWLYLLAGRLPPLYLYKASVETFVGYETTANAIVYGLITLALRPDIQANVMREIDSVLDEAKSQGRQELSYKEDFDKLEYTYGFMVDLPQCPSRKDSHLLIFLLTN